MNYDLKNHNEPVNTERRKILQGAVCAGVASFAPAVIAQSTTDFADTTITGKLICSISNPIKTLVLHNPTSKTITVDKVSQGAFMFDGSILDCNAACVNNAITIGPNQEVQVRFDKAAQISLSHNISDYRRIQSRVKRLNDGTRVIPFTATFSKNIATIA